MFWPLDAIKLQRAQNNKLNTVRNALWDGVAVSKRPSPRRSSEPAATQASYFNNFGFVEMKLLVRLKNKTGKESRK